VLAAGLLVGGPSVLAFFDGGFPDAPRIVAAMVAWLLVALTAVAAERPLPRGLPGRAALAGFLLLSGWTALSLTWAPLGTPALVDVQRVALYLAVLVAACAWLGTRPAAEMVEPGLLLGVVAVVGYGMSERFLPGLVELDASPIAFGRLEQPVTYWNGMGLLAAMGLVLSARLAGSAWRPRAVRAAGAAAAPLLGAGLLLTLSRGALLAAAAGMVVLLVIASERGQPRSVALTVGAAGVAAALAAALPDLDVVGSGASRSSGGALLAAVVILSAAAAVLQLRFSARAGDDALRAPASLRRWRLAIAVGLAVGLVAAAGAIDPAEPGGDRPRGTQRLGSLESERYRYWDVAVDVFVDHPVDGTGTGGFRVEWGREGAATGFAQDAHSLYLETAAELGLMGLAFLGLFLAGLAASAGRALTRHRLASVGPVAVVCTWAFHAAVDWDWEVPAVTLPALVAAGFLLALGDRDGAS
jgi:O-Antigen ligase